MAGTSVEMANVCAPSGGWQMRATAIWRPEGACIHRLGQPRLHRTRIPTNQLLISWGAEMGDSQSVVAFMSTEPLTNVSYQFTSTSTVAGAMSMLPLSGSEVAGRET